MAGLPRKAIRRCSIFALHGATSAILLGLSFGAHAGSPAANPVADPTSGPRVVGGKASSACAWPTTVSLNKCTGTLIHPQVVIYAAHCTTHHPTVYFGESRYSPARKVATKYCKVHPEGGTMGDDYAFCVLEEPVKDIPIVPPLMGEDVKLLQEGQMSWVVGFGVHLNGSGEFGVQYEAEIPITGFTKDGKFVLAGKDGKDGCNGDSGGPLFFKLPEGRGFRVFGITSFGDSPCGTGGGWALMHLGMPWFESESGFDLTPCHDAHGNPDPDHRCRNFPLDPGADGGSWDGNGCKWGPRTTENDKAPPSLRLVSLRGDPKQGGTNLPLEVVADAADDQKLAVVQLFVNGDGPRSLYKAPFRWTINESTRAATKIKLVAKDWVGNQKVVEHEVGIDNPSVDTSPNSSSSSSGDPGESSAGTSSWYHPEESESEDSSDTKKDPPQTGPGRSGCSLSESEALGPVGYGGLTLLLAGLLGRRRSSR